MLAATDNTGVELAAPADCRTRSAWRTYLLHSGLASLGLLSSAVAVAVAVRMIHVDAAAAHQIRVAGVALSYPAMNVAALVLLAMALIGATSLWRIATAAAGITSDHRKLMYRLAARSAGTRTIDVQGRPVTVCLFEDARPEAFCAGFRRPAIYLSTGALARLNAGEQEVVVAHELRHRDVTRCGTRSRVS